MIVRPGPELPGTRPAQTDAVPASLGSRREVFDPNDFLDGEAWGEVLRKGLGCRRLRTSDDGVGASIVWSVFRRATLAFAYPRFPAGLGESIHENRVLASHLRQLRHAGVDVAQLSSPVLAALELAGSRRSVSLPETVIDDLASWTEQRIAASAMSKIRRARKLGLRVDFAGNDDGPLLHRLYAESVVRKAGVERYGCNYFVELCHLASIDPRLSIGLAYSDTANPVGFIAVAHGQWESYYLHGGYQGSAAALRPGYACMHWAISQAKLRGSERFNFLVSPARQVALVKFKESFGGSTILRHHASVALSWRGTVPAWLFSRLARWRAG